MTLQSIANRAATGALMMVMFGLAGCASTSSDTQGQSITSTFTNMFKPNPPPTPTAPANVIFIDEDIPCPTVDIREGGAASRIGTGSAVRTQFTINTVARECTPTADGLSIKIGVEGIALIGTAGSPGPASAPLTFIVKRGDKTLATRTVQASVKIPADENHALFTVVEDHFIASNAPGDLTISVGFNR